MQGKMNDNIIGKTVTVIIDRPMGSYHSHHKSLYYPVNYGFIENIIAGDGEEQDAYVLGVDQPIKEFTGQVIAIVHRLNDVEDKWIVVPTDLTLTKDQIEEMIYFQEQYFEHEIMME